MSRPVAGPSADRNLLFGMLALQVDFIDRDALIRGLHAWVLEKHKPLGQILGEHGALAAANRAALDGLVERQLAAHGHDLHQSLAAVRTDAAVRAGLRQVDDPDLHASLDRMGSTPPASLSPEPGGVVRTNAWPAARRI
jgi:hypothetical protein